MGIVQSISQVLSEKLKFEPKNEHCEDESRGEDSTDDSQGEDSTDDNRGKDLKDDNCNKEYKASHFYGTHETQVSEGGEADLHQHVLGCKKNPGHTKFIPVNDFNIKHVPAGYHDDEMVELIRAVAGLTVRVDVRMASGKRPKFWPNTDQQYPFHNAAESSVLRLGTGIIWYVNKWTEKDIKGTCTCQRCQHSDNPGRVWGWVWVYTARHVVFDDMEARHTTCRLFYDAKDSPSVTLGGWKLMLANSEADWCWLYCVTCDVELLDRMCKMEKRWRDLWIKVNNKYKSSRDTDKLTFIVSHPHGCPKQVTVGQWIDRYKVSEHSTKYTYTTCTCPGSSGAYVYSPGYNAWFYDRHVHSGVHSDGTNLSGTGRDYA